MLMPSKVARSIYHGDIAEIDGERWHLRNGTPIIGVRLIERQSCRRVFKSAGPNRMTAKPVMAGSRSSRLSGTEALK
jgi:hypothetical protein